MREQSLTMRCVIGDGSATHGCLLVAPPEVVAVAYTHGIEFTDVAADLPESPPDSGLLVCLPHSQVHQLPAGWIGIWARAEPLPPGPWVPLPAASATNPQALGLALQTADHWRCGWLGWKESTRHT